MTDPVLDRLGPALADRYRLDRQVGAGGMATVYVAHDLKHDRDVALKVLHPELAAVIGAERFLQEIRTTARLQHPHILGLIDSGSADGLLFYVMPFVRGESLRDRLTREKQLPVGEAVRIASEVAGALDYAHREGVVHRDVKPENVLLHDGRVLVADFGIALALTAAGGGRMTQTGMSLGTPHYMSPEQALGEREITARSDVYALGAMTYEMLTGDPPFTGSTAQAILARVMKEKPAPLRAVRESVPVHVEAAVLTALEKLPADRWGTAKEFGDALAHPALTTSMTGAMASTAPARRVRGWQMLAGAALLTAVTLGGVLLRRRAAPPPPPPPIERFNLRFGTVDASDAVGWALAVSPDGARIAFTADDSLGRTSLYLRNLDQLEPTVVPGTVGALVPFFSPDGQHLGYYQDGRLRRVALAGGSASTIIETPYPAGAVWGADDRIIFARQGGLWRVPAVGGQPERILAPDSARGISYRWPDLVPRHGVLLVTAVDSAGGRLAAVGPAGDVTELGQDGFSPKWVAGDHIVWVSPDGVLLTARFDPRRLRLVEPPRRITEGVRTGVARVAKMGVSRTGTVAWLQGVAMSRELVLMNLRGPTRVLPAPLAPYNRPRFSRDGRRLAVTISAATGFAEDVWIYDLSSGTPARLTTGGLSRRPEWSPDGRYLYYVADRQTPATDALMRIPADGSGAPELVFESSRDVEEGLVTPDGRSVVVLLAGALGPDVWIKKIGDTAAAKPLLESSAWITDLALSPSGTRLAYSAHETGTWQVYLRELRAGSPRWVVTSAGGRRPKWGPSDRELYFRNRDSIYAVAVAPGAEPRFGAPEGVARLDDAPGANDFDVSPDGRTLAAARYDLSLRTPGIQLLVNWFLHRNAERP
ncbi:MAG TPA: protein kinase [Gemmatimonadales bacterium]